MTSSIIDRDTTPLWYPAPKPFGQTRTLRSIEVGDIGYLDDSGEFHAILNIFGPYFAPNGHSFQPISINPESMMKRLEHQKRHLFTSANIIRVEDQRNEHYKFSMRRKAGRSGAIIVLPDGGQAASLRSQFYRLPEVKAYFRHNAPSWYQHANQQQNISNGSLLFVQGTHKAWTWGIAAFNSKTEVTNSQNILFSQNESNRYEYQWDRYDDVERWKTNVGPASHELAQLRPSESPRLNQCIGIIASAVHLDDDTWRTYFARNSSSPTTKKPRSSFGSFSHILTRMSSMSSIKVKGENSGGRYLESLPGNQASRRL
ncbi:hypothetical protein HYPSUDRAFT_533728 [Hypholoma sublateritium FD-334 SS-4]|uniref:Uncharacterized protein n=1 Tax=Hypholoma sublateritium (strain FD-334 SS-4) TaxID=945553 RepID=A0A0D2NZR7_HYPSF|nr:hypothetical protein HYPSUDRAFT_533728 [Hypholoma sublateritium FD-334 SS-4]